jgi:hypothetical protein
MKKIIGILFLFGLLITSCDNKFASGDFNFDEMKAPTIIPPSPDAKAIGKKGYAITTSSSRWSTKLSIMKAHWFYTWGPNLSDLKPDNIEFVPMQWGRWNINDNIALLKNLKEAGKIHYFLGFNEPDGIKQANMTVDEAIALWPRLEEVGIPLGAPVTLQNPVTSTWMIEFMQKAAEKNYRIDFIPVHWYGGANASSFLKVLEDVRNLYGKPIWVTEFAPADWTATTPEQNKFTTTQVLNFMKEALPALENIEYVHRYAWFSFSQLDAAGTSSALFDTNGNLTELGNYYANFNPNLNIGPGKD